MEFGVQLASIIHAGLVIYLCGQLGSGKTFLVRAMFRALGYLGPVKSPSYTLLESYVISRLDFYHFDFYRFKDPYEWEDVGFRQYFTPSSVCLVEWPEKAQGLPRPDIDVAIHMKDGVREVRVRGLSATGRQALAKLENARN